MKAHQSSDTIINQAKRDNSEIGSLVQEQGKMLDFQHRQKGEDPQIDDQ